MDIQRCFRKAVLSLVAVASAAIGVAALQGSLYAAEPQTVHVLSRTHDPVIIKGSSVSALTDKPANQVFAYAWVSNSWVQIPFQVDEVSAEGNYVETEDGIFDGNDEIVLMASDASTKAPESPQAALSLSTPWYEIKVTDPVHDGEEAWVYLVHSSIITKTFTEDYVNFAPVTHQVQGENYVIGYATPDPWADVLRLGGGLTDILDRNKTRIFRTDSHACTGPLVCVTEEALPNVQDAVIKDGPVRAIIRGGRVQAYGTMLSWTNLFTLPTLLQGDVQLTLDFAPAVDGANFFNAAVPNGVVVDGAPDTVPATPFSPWTQWSTDVGTLIQVVDASKLTGTPTNVYIDDNSLDAQDTGDNRHWGEAGILMDDPGQVIEYNFNLYMLADKQPNLGEQYTDYYNQPLTVQATLVSPDGGSEYMLYTPIVK